MNKKLCVIDYGLNNIHSVGKALSKVNIEYKIIDNSNDSDNFTHVILPGVGSFDNAIENLKKKGFYNLLKTKGNNLKIFGICLGMQLIFNSSEESLSKENGLGLIEGKVVKMTPYKDKNIYLPQIGWNEILKNGQDELIDGLDKQSVYFVNSYFVNPKDKNIIKFYYLHGKKYPAIIKKDNILGAQFHPEKSESGHSIFKFFYDN